MSVLPLPRREITVTLYAILLFRNVAVRIGARDLLNSHEATRSVQEPCAQLQSCQLLNPLRY